MNLPTTKSGREVFYYRVRNGDGWYVRDFRMGGLHIDRCPPQQAARFELGQARKERDARNARLARENRMSPIDRMRVVAVVAREPLPDLAALRRECATECAAAGYRGAADALNDQARDLAAVLVRLAAPSTDGCEPHAEARVALLRAVALYAERGLRRGHRP